MKKVFIFFLILSFLLLNHFCFGQKNYIEGQVITLEGDTISGFINYQEWDKNPDKIEFKDSPDGSVKILTPANIKEFAVDHERYQGAIVEVDDSPYKVAELDYDPSLRLRKDTVFLQVLYLGSKNLFYYHDWKGKKHFFINYAPEYELLVYKQYMKTIDHHSNIMDNKKYAGQLVLYLNECDDIRKSIASGKYNLKSLSGIFDEYYRCTNEDYEYKKEKDKVKVKFGVIAGASYSSLIFKSEFFDYLVKTDFRGSVNPSVGISLNIVFSRNRGKWSINNELIFSTYKFKETYSDIESEERYTIENMEIGYSYLKLNNMVRYKLLIADWIPYLNVGISNGYAINETNYKLREYRAYSTLETSEGKALDQTRKYEQGLIFGLGGKYKHFSIEFRFELANGMSDYEALNSSLRRFYSFLGYTF